MAIVVRSDSMDESSKGVDSDDGRERAFASHVDIGDGNDIGGSGVVGGGEFSPFISSIFGSIREFSSTGENVGVAPTIPFIGNKFLHAVLTILKCLFVLVNVKYESKM